MKQLTSLVFLLTIASNAFGTITDRSTCPQLQNQPGVNCLVDPCLKNPCNGDIEQCCPDYSSGCNYQCIPTNIATVKRTTIEGRGHGGNAGTCPNTQQNYLCYDDPCHKNPCHKGRWCCADYTNGCDYRCFYP